MEHQPDPWEPMDIDTFYAQTGQQDEFKKRDQPPLETILDEDTRGKMTRLRLLKSKEQVAININDLMKSNIKSKADPEAVIAARMRNKEIVDNSKYIYSTSSQPLDINKEAAKPGMRNRNNFTEEYFDPSFTVGDPPTLENLTLEILPEIESR